MIPPIPDWEGLHPLVVHFPIALLLVAPVFVVIALASVRARRSLTLVGLGLMAAGTAAAYVSVESGEAAAELAIRTPEVSTVLEEHEELAEATSTWFTALTLAFAVIAIGPMFLKAPLKRAAQAGIHLIFLCAYVAGMLTLANTAHQGGRLVHEYGVHAMVAASDTPPAPALDDD